VNARTANAAAVDVVAKPLTFEPPRARAGIAAGSELLVVAAVILVVAICYAVTLTSGHVFVNDDFAAYVMHARNLVEGHPYSDIGYIPNPDAMWLSPSSGYPPVYPVLLAPIYWLFGLNLHAFKIVTIFCFVGFLSVYAELIESEIGRAASAILILLLSFNPVFWGQREFILSEFPYLLFSFGALLAIERVYAGLERDELKIGRVVLVSALLYCAYGTRTIGVALIFGLIAADLVNFRRPSRFLLCVLALTGFLIGVQALLLTSPKGYASAFHFSLQTIAVNTIYYGKTLSYVWDNGFSKGFQIVFALAFTAAAALGYLKRLWRERGAKEFYLLAYVAVLLAWNSEIGLRGLLPILPLYFFYGLRECSRFLEAARLPVRVIAAGAFVGIVAVSYAGKTRHEAALPAEPNVADADAASMFEYVRGHSSPEDVLVFSKPRSLALFTDRRVAALSPDQTPTQQAAFLNSIHATILVDAAWSEIKTGDSLAADGAKEVFHNGRYSVYRLKIPVGSAGKSTQSLQGPN
jgi:hypothetical protein